MCARACVCVYVRMCVCVCVQLWNPAWVRVSDKNTKDTYSHIQLFIETGVFERLWPEMGDKMVNQPHFYSLLLLLRNKRKN